MAPRWKITGAAVGVALIGTVPLLWVVDGSDVGQAAAATIQTLLGVCAVVVPWFVSSGSGPQDRAADTGKAKSTNGGRAQTGVRRPNGAGSGSASAERTGDASADGTGSSASTGVDYS